MTMYTINDIPCETRGLIRFVKDVLAGMGSDAPEMEARILLEKRLEQKWMEIQSCDSSHAITEQQQNNIASDLTARATGKPLSRIYGENQFWGLEFKLSEATLDPRGDSETIIALAMQRFDSKASLRILDMGTGTGCLLITLLSVFPNASGVGSDLSPYALEMAKGNAVLNNVDTRSEWILSDWSKNIEGQFDLVISNPPYIRSDVIPELDENVRNFDPILALDGGADGLQAYKKIISSLSSLLKPHGIALFEIGFDQADDVMRLGKESRFLINRVHCDLSGQPRVVEMSCGDK